MIVRLVSVLGATLTASSDCVMRPAGIAAAIVSPASLRRLLGVPA